MKTGPWSNNRDQLNINQLVSAAWFVIIFQELNSLHSSINTIVTRIQHTRKTAIVIANIVCTWHHAKIARKKLSSATYAKIWWEKIVAALYLLSYDCSVPAAGTQTQPSQQFIWQFYCGHNSYPHISRDGRLYLVFSQQQQLRECCNNTRGCFLII